MKSLKFLKEIMIHMTLAFFLLFAVSCDDGYSSEDTRDVAEDQNDENFDNDNKEEDAEFLVNAAAINLEEMHLGQLAQQKGTSSQVKEFGKMMEDAHTTSLNELKSLANSKMVTIPSSPTDNAKDAYQDLNDESGKDFDEAYIDRLVNSHNDAIDTYEDAANDSSDPEIRNWASSSLPGLRKHRDQLMEFQKQFDNMYLENNN